MRATWADAVDLFAGAGGFTAGAEAAGIRVRWAADNWPDAVNIHARNHPATEHACQDLHQADWSRVPAHDVLLASPACQGHSKARGREREHHDASRSTAWPIVSCAEVHRPAAVVVENVEDFLRWELYPAWRMALEQLGYAVAPHVVDAADCGVPQHRRRMFLVATRSANPVALDIPRRAHVPASQVIDFESGRWSQVDRPGRSPRTLERIESGRQRFGGRFLTAYYGNERGGRSLDRPLGTVTTRDRYAVVDGDRMRMLSAPEYRDAMSFPRDYQLPDRHRDAVFMLGNAVPPGQAREVLSALRRAI